MVIDHIEVIIELATKLMIANSTSVCCNANLSSNNIISLNRLVFIIIVETKLKAHICFLFSEMHYQDFEINSKSNALQKKTFTFFPKKNNDAFQKSQFRFTFYSNIVHICKLAFISMFYPKQMVMGRIFISLFSQWKREMREKISFEL